MKHRKSSLAECLQAIPGPKTGRWPDGERFKEAFAHGSMSVELYAPQGTDPQLPHTQDELYFIQRGTGTFCVDGINQTFAPGDCFFVAAGVSHRFESFSDDFCVWVVFWGPPGGESI